MLPVVHNNSSASSTQRELVADRPPQEEVNYFPSKFDPVRNATRTPGMMSGAELAGQREKQVIEKENNFQQAGERFRSFDADRCGPAGGSGWACVPSVHHEWMTNSRSVPTISAIVGGGAGLPLCVGCGVHFAELCITSGALFYPLSASHAAYSRWPTLGRWWHIEEL